MSWDLISQYFLSSLGCPFISFYFIVSIYIILVVSIIIHALRGRNTSNNTFLGDFLQWLVTLTDRLNTEAKCPLN